MLKNKGKETIIDRNNPLEERKELSCGNTRKKWWAHDYHEKLNHKKHEKHIKFNRETKEDEW